MAELSTTAPKNPLQPTTEPHSPVGRSEDWISEQWDACLERTVINFSLGLAAGALTAVVLTSKQNVNTHIA